jgi:putative membrane protein
MEGNQKRQMGTQTRQGVVTTGGIVLALVLVGLLGGGLMMGPGMMLGGPLLLVGLLLLVVWMLRGGRLAEVTSAWDRPRGENALDILDARYARGELSDEQYEAMRRTLQRPTGT